MPIHIMYLTIEWPRRGILRVWHNWTNMNLGHSAEASDCVWIVPGTLDPSI